MNLTKLLTGNAHDYEQLIALIYKIGEVTGEDITNIVAKLDDIYDKTNGAC